jgi:protein phosphatase
MTASTPPEFRFAYRFFLSSFPHDIMSYANGHFPIILPRYRSTFLQSLFQHVLKLFQSEPVVLEITPPCIVVGDLHGQVLDLLRILSHYGDPISRTYLFLGDIIDRGEFSVETLALVYLLKAVFPTNVFIIRGNHEFSALCSQHGFLTQVFSLYGFSIFQSAVETFSWLPIAAKIDEILCIHGGLGPNVLTITNIQKIVRPIDEFGDIVLDSVVWSDPCARIMWFEPSTSRRMGCLFGGAAADNFLRGSQLKMLIRAHECVEDGFRWHFGGRVLTVFSASNYTGSVGNSAAVAEVTAGNAVNIQQFQPLPWVKREAVELRAQEAPPVIEQGGSVPPVRRWTSVPKMKDGKKQKGKKIRRIRLEGK